MMFFIFCVLMPLFLLWITEPKCKGCGKRRSETLLTEITNETTEIQFQCKHCGMLRTEKVTPPKTELDKKVNNKINELLKYIGK